MWSTARWTRPDRQRLGAGERDGRGVRDQPDLLQAEPAEGALGARGAGGLAVPQARGPGGKIIATELVEFTKRYFASRKIPVKVEFSWARPKSNHPHWQMQLSR